MLVGGGPADDPDYFVHTNLQLLIDVAGTKCEVINQGGVRGEDARSLPLAPGRYQVRAAGSQGMVVVPVLIVAGRTTVVDLEARCSAALIPGREIGSALPDGQAIGWRPMP